MFSFKLRGAYNKMTHLTAAEKAAGVLTCSAGNHAQGVALAAQRMGVRATILMPVFTPQIKVRAVRALGAEVVLHGNDFDEAAAECRRLSAESGRVIVHPYDDPHVIAGQGTIGVELLRQWTHAEPIHTVFVCVGGGGLIAGISTYIKALLPDVRVVGVEADDACAMTQSLRAGQRVELKEVGLFADGAAVRSVGVETFRLCQQHVDGMELVTNDEICAAIKDTFEDTRSILEPAGALALAGCKRHLAAHPELRGRSFVCVTSGANMNFNRLRFVAERAELGEDREAMLAITIKERPGEFMALHGALGGRNVTEFSYRYGDPEQAHIYCSFEVKERKEVAEVMDALRRNGMKPVDLSHNDMAKDHTVSATTHPCGLTPPSRTNAHGRPLLRASPPPSAALCVCSDTWWVVAAVWCAMSGSFASRSPSVLVRCCASCRRSRRPTRLRGTFPCFTTGITHRTLAKCYAAFR